MRKRSNPRTQYSWY